MALHFEECDFLGLRQRQVPPGERLCRESEQCWWHAARLSEQSGSDRLRYAGVERHLRCSAPRQSPAKIYSVHHAPPPVAGPAMVANRFDRLHFCYEAGPTGDDAMVWAKQLVGVAPLNFGACSL
jgi:hypothetical protein